MPVRKHHSMESLQYTWLKSVNCAALNCGSRRKCSRCLFLLLSIFVMLFYIFLSTVINNFEVPLTEWPSNATRNASIYVRPFEMTSIIQGPDICNPNKKWHKQNVLEEIYLLVFVTSIVSNFEERNAIRSTWASIQETLDGIRVAFVIGTNYNSSEQGRLLEESELYGDIIQENFEDTYYKLTIKTLMILKWFILNCDRKVRFIMKTDDDMFINLTHLTLILKGKKQHNLLLGSLICYARPILDPSNKWYSPKYMFDNNFYPQYLSGTGYVMSSDVVNHLYNAALSIPIFHLEDVFITGICAHEIMLRPEDDPGFSYGKQVIDACSYHTIITSHRHNPSDLINTWSNVQTRKSNCPIPRKRKKKYCLRE